MPLLDFSTHAFGLDIGDRSIKAVELRLSRFSIGKPRLTMHAWNEIPIPEGMFSPGKIERPAEAAALLRSVVQTATPKPIRPRAVVLSLPESTTFVKTIEIPRVPREQVALAIARESEEHIPLPLAEAILDWQLLVPLEQDKTIRAIVAAAPRALVENFVTTLEDTGLIVLAVEAEALSLVRGLLLEDLLPGDNAIGILDLGATRSNIIIFDEGTIQLSTSIRFSGDTVTKMIAERLNISWEDAEKIKIECGLEPERCENRIRPIIATILSDLVSDIRTALNAYRQSKTDGHPVGLLYITGGSANATMIDTFLRQKLHLKVHRANPLRGFLTPASFPAERAASFTTAIGLARRATRYLPVETEGALSLS